LVSDDSSGYSELHEWIRKNRLRPSTCERCHVNPPREVAAKERESWRQEKIEYMRKISSISVGCAHHAMQRWMVGVIVIGDESPPN